MFSADLSNSSSQVADESDSATDSDDGSEVLDAVRDI